MNEKKCIDRIYESFMSWIGSGKKRWVFKYFFGSFIPLFIPLFYKFDNFKDWVTSGLKTHTNILYVILSPWWMQLIIIALVFVGWPVFEKIMEERLDRQKNDSMKNKKEMTSLLACISSVVREKRSRFYECSLSNTSEPAEIFSSITKPIQQMNKIALSMQSYFQSVFDDNSLECYLINVEKKQLSSMQANTCGGKPQIDLNFLNKNEIIKKCIEKQEIMVVENVKDSVRKNRFNQGQIGKIKSTICYPVKDGNEIAYLWLITSENCTFKKDRNKMFQYVLKEFSERLILESYLQSMLEKVK